MQVFQGEAEVFNLLALVGVTLVPALLTWHVLSMLSMSGMSGMLDPGQEVTVEFSQEQVWLSRGLA